jgi:hypothetical protein
VECDPLATLYLSVAQDQIMVALTLERLGGSDVAGFVGGGDEGEKILVSR